MLFMNMIILGSLISISSSSWYMIWMGLEINLLSLMPLMKMSKNKYSTEASIKYFIVQAMASALLLFSIIILSMNFLYPFMMNVINSLMICSTLMLKLGMSPFHFWFPEVLSGLNWNINFIILTWQKIAPMILLTYTTMNPIYLSIFIISSSMISGIQGMNQTCLRKIMAYSSINHMAWMLSAILNSLTIWFYYFIIYFIINLNIIIMLNKFNIYFINQLSKLFQFNKKIKFMFMMNFLSLGGLPPFLGFLPKWLTINSMIESNLYMVSFLLIIFTLMSLFFYIRITFTSFTFNSMESMNKIFYYSNSIFFLINFISLMSLFLCTMIFNFL
uniref:NADH-ubiquinone oxidoreductase chain 2 n=1 Tax=Curculionoidea sp. 17 KM-2017 TaxID=2219400 RepID=A0A346RGP3_9CUCU|nr:NADH dehydrogenase subunit 2 [Curculionoidea sp. 17 KM-2017]